jgi:hypothetical protein
VRIWPILILWIISVCKANFNFFPNFYIRVSTMKINPLFSILDMASTHKCHTDHIPLLPPLCLP